MQISRKVSTAKVWTTEIKGLDKPNLRAINGCFPASDHDDNVINSLGMEILMLTDQDLSFAGNVIVLGQRSMFDWSKNKWLLLFI